MPAVSIIVPNFNHGRFLPDRLESIFSQSFQDFEVILLDDSSTDNSRGIIESYSSHPKLAHIVYNERNSGSTFKQWKKGFELATGKYVWIAESDDIAESDFLKVMTIILDVSPSVGIAFCQSLIINDKNEGVANNVKWTQEISFVDWSEPFTIKGEDAIRHMFLFKNVIPNASAVIFRQEMLKNLPMDFTNYKFTGDWLVWTKFLLHGDLSYTPLLLNRFRSHEDVSRKRKSLPQKIIYLLEIYAIQSILLDRVAVPAQLVDRSKEYLAGRAYTEMGVKKFFSSAAGLELGWKLQGYDSWFFFRLVKYKIKGTKSMSNR